MGNILQRLTSWWRNTEDQERVEETEQWMSGYRQSLHTSVDLLKTNTDWLIDHVNNKSRLDELKEYMDDYDRKIDGLKEKSTYENVVVKYLKEVESKLSDLLNELNKGSYTEEQKVEFVDWQKRKIRELRKHYLFPQDNSPFHFILRFDAISNSLLGCTQEVNEKAINPSELKAQLTKKKKGITKLRRTIAQKIAKRQEDYWKECIKKWYPNLQTSPYFLPPLHFNKVQLEEMTIGQLSVYTIKTARKDSSERGESAQEGIMQRLHELTTKRPDEPMMVISQLDFGRYLNKPCYAAAADCYPQLKDIPISEHRQGDFDVLIIHRKHGLIACEIKAVGWQFKTNEINPEQREILRSRIEKAKMQLDKAEKFLQVTANIQDIKVTKSLFLPNVSKNQFQSVVRKGSTLERELRQCFGKKAEYEENVFFKGTYIEKWWDQITKTPGQEMSQSDYESIVSRFCGPATTVNVFCVSPPHLELRTRGEAVAETGRRFARFTLLPQQVSLIHRTDDPFVYLCGPPGTGKTVVLILKALKWMEEGYDVHLVSTWYKSLPAFYFIEYHLQNNTERSTVRPYVYDLAKSNDVEKATEELKLAAATEGKDKFCVIIDEPGPDLREDAIRMFPQGNETYEYKTDMEKETALAVLKENFSMEAEDVHKTFAKQQNGEWKLTVVELQEFCTNYAIFNKWRQEHAKDIFLEYAQENLPLNKDEALKMVQKKYPQVKCPEEMFQTQEYEMGLPQFISMHAPEVFKEHLKDYKKSLTEGEALQMLCKVFNLTKEIAQSEFGKLKDDNGNLSATQEVKQFTEGLTSGFVEAIRVSSKDKESLEEWGNTTFKSYVDRYGSCLGKNEAVEMLEKKCQLSPHEANLAFEKYKNDNVLDENGFRKFYTDHAMSSSETGKHAQTVFKGIIKEYKKNMTKNEATAMLKSKFKLTENELNEIEPKMNVSNRQWFQQFYSQDLKAESLRRQYAKEIFLRYAPRNVIHLDENEMKNIAKLAGVDMKYETIINIVIRNVRQTGKLSIHMFWRQYNQIKEHPKPPESCLDKWFFLSTSDADGESQKKEDTKKMFQGAFSMSKKDAKYYTCSIFRKKRELNLEQFQDFYAKYTNAFRRNENNFSRFCEDLSKKIPELCLWIGAIERHIKPMCMREEKLCVPLRCPPEIVRKVKQSQQITQRHVHDYVLNSHPLPTFGLPFQKIKHKGADLHDGEQQPKDCSQCGKIISDILKQLVDVSNSSSYLQYCDVIVICEDPQDDSKLVLALNGNDIPVRVVSRDADVSKIKNTSLRRSDKVTVSHYRHVHGLERKVVILAGNNNWKNDYQLLYDMSRCTGLLVLIDAPEFK